MTVIFWQLGDGPENLFSATLYDNATTADIGFPAQPVMAS